MPLTAAEYNLLLLDRGSHGDEGHFVTIEGHAVFLPDDVGTGATGKGGKFTRHAVEKKLIEHREAMSEGTGGDLGSSKFTFHKSLPDEVKRHIENNPAARRLFTTTNDTSKAGGADAFAALGDKYWELADEHAGASLTKAKESARASNDPEAHFLAALHDLMPGSKAKQGVLKAKSLREGQSFTIHGAKVHVTSDPDNGLMIEGDGIPLTPVGALTEIPIDKHSLKAGKAKRREVVPFSAEQYAALVGSVGTVYLSAATLYPSASEPPPRPAQFNGQDIRYYWADALSEGQYTHPITGAPVDASPKRLDRLARNLNLAVDRGVSVPIVLGHKRENAEGTVGYLFGARREGKKLMVLHGFVGEDAEKIALRNRVSLGIDSDYRDALGNRYGDAIRHSALTCIPVIPGQQGFIKA